MRKYRLMLPLMALSLMQCSFDQRVLGKSYSLNMNPPQGAPEFQQGWREGCQTGVSAISNQFNKLFFDYAYQYELAKQQTLYEKGWNMGNAYCSLSVYVGDNFNNNPALRRWY